MTMKCLAVSVENSYRIWEVKLLLPETVCWHVNLEGKIVFQWSLFLEPPSAMHSNPSSPLSQWNFAENVAE